MVRYKTNIRLCGVSIAKMDSSKTRSKEWKKKTWESYNNRIKYRRSKVKNVYDIFINA
jgi:hypothetical protein